jgi:hypothetical protein
MSLSCSSTTAASIVAINTAFAAGEVQGGAHLVGEYRLCRFYCLGGAIGCSLHGGLHPAVT